MRLLLILFLLGACTAGGGDYKAYLSRKGVIHTAPDRFDHCRGYGCRILEQTTLSAEKWGKLKTLFKGTDNAAEERQAIARAVGIMETDIGERTGTKADIAGTYHKIGDFQHDCVDESVNTTIYLSLLRDKELIRFHDITAPQARVPPFSLGLGPHQTAVIKEKDSGTRYAVDSWFHDNGHPAEIVPVAQWFFGWHPDKEGS